jgi:hypothetical protein
MKFVVSVLKFSVVAFWLVAGTVGILAARHNQRMLDASVAELGRYRTAMTAEVVAIKAHLESADNEAKTLAGELSLVRDQLAASLATQESVRLEAAKWKGKFDALCAAVTTAANAATNAAAEVVSQ